MTNSKNILGNLSTSIIKGEANLILDEINEPNEKLKNRKLNIYLDGYIERLSKAILDDYPATKYFLENKNKLSEFNKLIINYIKNNPSASYNLDFYPIKFEEFIQENTDDLFLKEISKLESLIIKIFLGDESIPFQLIDLSKLSEEELPNLKLKPRTASAIIKFNYDVEKYLSEFRKDNSPKIIESEIYLFICRNNNEVKRHYLEKEEFEFLNLLFNDNDLGQATELFKDLFLINDLEISIKLQNWFPKWLEGGFFKLG